MQAKAAAAAAAALLCCLSLTVAEDPYRFFDWVVTFGDIYPLGVRQQVCAYPIPFSLHFCWEKKKRKKNNDVLVFLLQGILINGQFPGPDIFSVTNDNLIINVHNNLTEPFLLSWQVSLLLCAVFIN